MIIQEINEESSSTYGLSKVESAESFHSESNDDALLPYYKMECLIKHYAPIRVEPGTSSNVGRVQNTLEQMGK